MLVLAEGALAAFGPRDEVFKALQQGQGAAQRRPAPPAAAALPQAGTAG
jgi:ABC-type protease/lipase transport system fused ATPase/permease subunit